MAEQPSWWGKEWDDMTGGERAEYNAWVHDHNQTPKYDTTTSTSGHSTSGSSHSTENATKTSTGTTTSTKTSSSVSGNRSPELEYDENGNVTKESLDSLNEKDFAVLDDAYGHLTGAIGASGEKAREYRKQREEKLRKQQKMNDLVNSARILSDIISAGIGGNVYARNNGQDLTQAEIDKLHDLQNAEDAQAQLQRAQANLEYAKAKLGIVQNNRALATSKFSNDTATGTESASSTATSNSTADNSQKGYVGGTTTSNKVTRDDD